MRVPEGLGEFVYGGDVRPHLLIGNGPLGYRLLKLLQRCRGGSFGVRRVAELETAPSMCEERGEGTFARDAGDMEDAADAAEDEEPVWEAGVA